MTHGDASAPVLSRDQGVTWDPPDPRGLRSHQVIVKTQEEAAETEEGDSFGSRLLLANSSKMRTTTARLLALIVSLCQGCPPQAVWQSGPQTGDRRSSVKLSCRFSMRLRLQKPSLTWVRKDENDAETTIYPSDGSTDATKAHMDAEAFKMSMDAGILLSDLRRRDSGWYYCCVTILSGGAQEECRGDGTYLTVRATMYDTLIACSPLGVFGAALLVLHCMVYKQWMEYRRVHARPEIH